MSRAIVWFRYDLRLFDNPALSEAAARYDEIIPVYILQDHGQAQAWWLHHALNSLNNDLKQRNSVLILKKGDCLAILNEIIDEFDVDAVFWNRCYDSHSIARDKIIKSELTAKNIQVESFNGSLLLEPWQVKNKSGSHFKVFTPFWKQCLAQLQPRELYAIPEFNTVTGVASDELDDWQLLPTKPDWASQFGEYWQPGEAGAEQKLESFIESTLNQYKGCRDKPALDATSKLSPHLHFGEISPWQIWHAIEQARPSKNVKSVDHFLSEVGWREFSYHLLYHHPNLPESNFKPQFNAFPWHQDADALKRWQQGQTGYPIVDAGMRELWHTGYMHNRVRMIVASFLTKDLFIDWRDGAKWFFDTLLDADIANNSASWQWVAGSGADAAPYFRIFNPVLQSEKFDAEGEYIKRWVPELASLDKKFIHKPWDAPADVITLGKDYPHPMVDHGKARNQALAYYEKIK